MSASRQEHGSHVHVLRNYIVSILVLVAFVVKSQNVSAPAARFSFNEGSKDEEVTHKKARLVGTVYVKDRFGNENSAVYLLGNQYSYINLGSYPALKPIAGSISMWVKVDMEIWSGIGYKINPFIITKNSAADDFYEAYCIYYFLEGHNIGGSTTKDSTMQINIISSQKFSRFDWHHLVLAYDDIHEALYIDGKLEASVKKGFRTRFLEGDSVMVGLSANKKNNRFLNGAVDDIAFYDRVLTTTEVMQLYEAPDPGRGKDALHWLFIGLALAALISLVIMSVRHRLNLSMKKEKQRLELYNVMLETELRVNKALMNPHFVFNSLNALQSLILKNENDLADDYLIKFSKLIRKILESNMSSKITLDLEIELLKGYLEVEDLRFEENIHYKVNVAPDIIPAAVKIPVMMIQPFVENAIWHGLLTKKGDKLVIISFRRAGETYLCCTIEDNGVGRKVKKRLPGEKNSLAIGFIEQRLNLLNQIHRCNCTLEIEDKPDLGGTIVRILLPILK